MSLRLDKYLTEKYPDQSRSYFQKLIEQGLVLLNGKPAKKRELVEEGDEVEVEFALTRELTIEPEEIPLTILYEDGDIIVIDKPPGLVVHPGAGNWSGTFVNALLYHCQSLADHPDKVRPGIVHRLDKGTSGVLIAAKNEEAQRHLVTQFANREVYKEYLAVCVGAPLAQTIDAPLGRHPGDRKKQAVVENGKQAITRVTPLKTEGKLSLLKVVLETGRTHQIRVHLRHIHTPVLGDPTYGFEASNEKYNVARQLLHAHILKLKHPTSGQEMTFEAPIPDDIRRRFP